MSEKEITEEDLSNMLTDEVVYMKPKDLCPDCDGELELESNTTQWTQSGTKDTIVLICRKCGTTIESTITHPIRNEKNIDYYI